MSSTTEYSRLPKFSSSPIHGMLLIPELLSCIFEFGDDHSLAMFARVCRMWSGLACDWLWRDLDSLLPLLELVSPLSQYEEWGWSFDADGPEPDWEKFASYARRVHYLTHDDSDTRLEHDSLLSPEVVIHILRRNTSVDPASFLLPNVRGITWRAEHEQTLWQLLPFISSHLKTLDIDLHSNITPNGACRLLNRLAGACNDSLQYLRLATDCDYEGNKKIHRAVSNCLGRQTGLSTVLLPYLNVTTDIVHAVAPHSNLRSFEALGEFATVAELQNFLTDFALSCPLIEHLSLDLWGGLSSSERIRFPAIKPLLQCIRLTKLEIFYSHAIALDTDDIRAMGAAWRGMEILSLCAEEQRPSNVGTPLSSLAIFAANFPPTLRELALYFTTQDQLPKADVITSRFKSLKVLGVGTSVIPESKILAAGEFVGALTPYDVKIACTIVGGSRMPVFGLKSATRPRSTGKKAWDDVFSLVQMAHRFQIGQAAFLSQACSQHAVDEQ